MLTTRQYIEAILAEAAALLGDQWRPVKKTFGAELIGPAESIVDLEEDGDFVEITCALPAESRDLPAAKLPARQVSLTAQLIVRSIVPAYLDTLARVQAEQDAMIGWQDVASAEMNTFVTETVGKPGKVVTSDDKLNVGFGTSDCSYLLTTQHQSMTTLVLRFAGSTDLSRLHITWDSKTD